MNRLFARRLSQLLPLLMPLLAGCPIDSRPLGDAEESIAGSAGAAGGATVLGGRGGSGNGSGGTSAQAGDAGGNDGGASSADESGAGSADSGAQPIVAGSGGAGGRAALGGAGGGHSSAGGSHSGASGSAGASAGGGAGASSTVCPTADPAAEPGCQASLASNATFDVDAIGWSAELNALETWQRDDADGRKSSGSLSVRNQVAESSDALAFTGARQCLRVSGGKPYRLMAKLRIASGQDGSAAGGLNVGFYDSVDCSGSESSPVTSSLPRDLDSWLPLSVTSSSPASARSMSVRLVALKKFSAAAVTVSFDDVLVTMP